MKNNILIGVCAGFVSLSAASAQSEPPAQAVKEAMAKVEWMVGEWEGEGWRADPQGDVHQFNVREVVEPKLGGLILVIEGRGWREGEGGERIENHHAVGIFSFDAYSRQYHFDAFVREGYQSRSTPEISEGKYTWSHPAGPNAKMQYTAQLTDDGAWLETGAYCRGDDCQQTFEMRLTRAE